MPAKIDMAKFAKFCKDMGFIFQSSEIYGGINGFWDYGPLGVELKKNIKDAWWQDMVRNPPPGPDGDEIKMVGLDCSIIMNPEVWVASGHAAGFADPMVDCKETGFRYRADHVTIFFMEWVNPNGDSVHLEPYYATVLTESSSDEELIAPHKKQITELKKKTASSYPGHEFRLTRLMGVNNRSAIYDAEIRSKTVIQGATKPGTLMEPRAFNLMFESHAGPIKSDENKVYLRPETAQGIFANYRNVLNSTRLKLPFGIAQVGKAFRNEINPRNFTFRSREFEQMEIEFFCNPEESMKWYEYWRDLRKKWYSTLGIKSDNLKPREQDKDELAHYSIGTTDIEYMFPFSEEPQELEGVAHRGAFDLNAHATKSGKVDDLAYFDEERWNNDSQTMSTRSFKEWLKSNPSEAEIAKYKFVPHVIEPSAGADRFTLAVLCEAFHEEQVPDSKGNMETRTVMRFHPRLAPIKSAIFPLVNKDGMPEKALKLYRELKAHFNVVYDDKGAIGRRYRRQDEAGTPFCVTIDGDTLTNDTVTIRDRDTLKQERIPMSEVKATIRKVLEG
jgi:glycyl-tRNA synthetase